MKERININRNKRGLEMKKYLKILFFLCAFLMVLGFAGGTAFAIEAWNGDLVINGFVRNDSAVRLEDGEDDLHSYLSSGDYVMCRNTLQIEGRWKLQDNLSVTGIYRSVYEASLELDDDLEQNMIDAGNGHNIGDYERQNELRELYVDVSWGDGWAMRAGKQQIVWGEALGFRMSDVINPLDYSWNYFYPSWEDIRVPLWGIDLTKRLNEDAVLELVWLPGTFDDGFESTVFGTAGTNWWPVGYPQLFLDAIGASEPENDIRNSEVGARLKLMLGSWDTSFFWFYNRNDNPIFDADWLAKMGAGRDDFFNYPFVNLFGGSFNYYSKAADAVFRGECVYTIDQPYNPLAPGAVVPEMIFEKDTFAYFVAMDKLLTIPAINERNFVFLSMQFAQKFIFDHEDGMDSNDMDDGEDLQNILTFYTSTGYLYERLTPSLFLMWITNGEWLVNPQVTYDIDDYWSTGIGAQIADADNTGGGAGNAFYGRFADNDQVYAFVKFGF